MQSSPSQWATNRKGLFRFEETLILGSGVWSFSLLVCLMPIQVIKVGTGRALSVTISMLLPIPRIEQSLVSVRKFSALIEHTGSKLRKWEPALPQVRSCQWCPWWGLNLLTCGWIPQDLEIAGLICAETWLLLLHICSLRATPWKSLSCLSYIKDEYRSQTYVQLESNVCSVLLLNGSTNIYQALVKRSLL